jgi:hypothetical protein
VEETVRLPATAAPGAWRPESTAWPSARTWRLDHAASTPVLGAEDWDLAGAEVGPGPGPDAGAGSGHWGGAGARAGTDRWAGPDPVWDGQPPRHRPPRVWPWLTVLLAAAGLPALGWAGGFLRSRDLAAAVGASALLSLLAHAAARRPLLLALLLPPLAWGLLLAERTPGPARRRAWTATVLTGALALAAAGAVVWTLGPWEGRLPPPAAGARAFAAGLGLAAAGTYAPSLAGVRGLLARLALLPLWLTGALLVLVGVVLGLPPAVPLGRVRPLGRFAAGTLAGAVETFRSPRADGRCHPNLQPDPA